VLQETLLDPEGVVSQLSVPYDEQTGHDRREYEKDLKGDVDDSNHFCPLLYKL